MDKTFEILITVLLLGIIAEVYVLTRPKKRHETKQISMLVDTSVLMDGRVIDLAKTGFLMGQVIVPKSVLAELQLLADGADHAKRERARLGMDVVKELQDMLDGSFKLLQDGAKTVNGVDEQLISLAKETDSAILTLDYNLNKVAQVEGVKVLNINELAKSIRMVHLPGDAVEIELTQKGQSSDQAVGYLSDGTMVVVEQAKKMIGKVARVEIIRSLQTDAGKMMFAKLLGGESTPAKRTVTPAPKQSSQGRRSTSLTAKKVTKSTKAKDEKKTPAKNTSTRTKTTRPTRTSSATSATNSNTQKRRKPKTSAQREAELIRLVNSQD